MLIKNDLEWPQCYNTRDLGGLPTVESKTTRYHSFVRSDVLSRLTSEGKKMMVDYGIKTIIDLRFAFELKENPAVAFNDSDGYIPPTYVNIPFGEIRQDGDDRIHWLENYGIWIEMFADSVKCIMKGILESAEGIIFHCHSGKDRTGMLSALLLTLAGVPDDLVVADYARTRIRLKPLYDEGVMKPKGTYVPEEQIWIMLSYINEKRGGIKTYLQDIGLKDAEITELKRRLVS